MKNKFEKKNDKHYNTDIDNKHINDSLELYTLKKNVSNNRSIIIAVVILTAVNVIFILSKVNIIFPISLIFPTVVLKAADFLANRYSITNLVPIVLALIVVYILFYIFLYRASKKSSAAALTALILISLDAVTFVWYTIAMNDINVYLIFNIVFYAWVLVTIFRLFDDMVKIKQYIRRTEGK